MVRSGSDMSSVQGRLPRLLVTAVFSAIILLIQGVDASIVISCGGRIVLLSKRIGSDVLVLLQAVDSNKAVLVYHVVRLFAIFYNKSTNGPEPIICMVVMTGLLPLVHL